MNALQSFAFPIIVAFLLFAICCYFFFLHFFWSIQSVMPLNFTGKMVRTERESILFAETAKLHCNWQTQLPSCTKSMHTFCRGNTQSYCSNRGQCAKQIKFVNMVVRDTWQKIILRNMWRTGRKSRIIPQTTNGGNN